MFAVRQSTLVRGENPQLFRFRFAVVTCGAACRVKFHCSIVVSDIKKMFGGLLPRCYFSSKFARLLADELQRCGRLLVGIC